MHTPFIHCLPIRAVAHPRVPAPPALDPPSTMADGGEAVPERLSSKLLLRGKTGIEILNGPPANPRAALRAEEARGKFQLPRRDS